MKQAEAFLQNVETYDFRQYLALGTSLFSVQQLSANTLLFHSQNVLAKSFTVFVTDFAEIFWEKNPSATPESGFLESYCIP